MFLTWSHWFIFFDWDVIWAAIVNDLFITVDFKVKRFEFSEWDHVVKRSWRFSFNLFLKRCYWSFKLNRKLKISNIWRIKLKLKLNLTLLIKYILRILPIILNHSITISLCLHHFIRQSFLQLHQSFTWSLLNDQSSHRF